jgi:hypothetical protein
MVQLQVAPEQAGQGAGQAPQRGMVDRGLAFPQVIDDQGADRLAGAGSGSESQACRDLSTLRARLTAIPARPATPINNWADIACRMTAKPLLSVTKIRSGARGTRRHDGIGDLP